MPTDSEPPYVIDIATVHKRKLLLVVSRGSRCRELLGVVVAKFVISVWQRSVVVVVIIDFCQRLEPGGRAISRI